jgi:hypothetical protein
VKGELIVVSAKITKSKIAHPKPTEHKENKLIFFGKLAINGFKKPKRIHPEESYVIETNYAVSTEVGAVASVNSSPLIDDINWTSDVDTESSIAIHGIPDVVYAHGLTPTIFLTATLIRETRWTILKHVLNKKGSDEAFYLLSSLDLKVFPGLEFRGFSGYTTLNEDDSFGFTAAGSFVNRSSSRLLDPEVQISLMNKENFVDNVNLKTIPQISPISGGGVFEISLNGIDRADAKNCRSIDVDLIVREELSSYSFLGHLAKKTEQLLLISLTNNN